MCVCVLFVKEFLTFKFNLFNGNGDDAHFRYTKTRCDEALISFDF